MTLAEKRGHRRRRTKKRTFRKRRRRRSFLLLVGIAVLVLGAGAYYGKGNLVVPVPNSSDIEGVAEVEDSTVTEAPVEDQDTEEDEVEAVLTPPDDPTMYLTIPKLGVYGALVDGSEVGLEVGTRRVGSGYPWLPGSNTYIAGHRIGFPGTGSDHIFYDLPSLTPGDEIILNDSLGRVYKYRVSKVFAVAPLDVWVMDPVAGKDVVTLQTCTETPNDWWTIGSTLMSSGPESGRLIVQADRA